MRCFFSWLYEHNQIPDDVVQVVVREVDMDPKGPGEIYETLVAVLPPDWLYYNKLCVSIIFPDGKEIRVYTDGAVLLFEPGAKEGKYLYRQEL